MGLLSNIFKGVKNAVSGLLGKKPVQDDSWRRHKKRHVSAGAPVTPAPTVDDSWRRHKKRHVSAGAPVNYNAEIEALKKQNEALLKVIRNGGVVGNVKASSDPDKFAKQQKIADAIDAAREESGAMPGTAEYDEVRAQVLEAEGINDYGNSDPPEFNPEADLTAEDREAYYAIQGGTPI